VKTPSPIALGLDVAETNRAIGKKGVATTTSYSIGVVCQCPFARPRGQSEVETMNIHNQKTVTLALGLLVATAASAHAETFYTIHGWPAGLSAVPCDAFVKNTNGSWSQTGTIVIEPGNNVYSHNTFLNTLETRIIDEHCGK
jgi:hypothetical protein